MKWFLLLSLFVLPVQAAQYECQLKDGTIVNSDKPCAKGGAVVDEEVYPNNISSRAQAIARAEAIRAKRVAEKNRGSDHE